MMPKLAVQPKIQLKNRQKDHSYDLIIVGGGPAGLAAALYAQRARLKLVLIEKMILGGLLSTAYHIDNYPGFPEGISGMELGSRMEEQVKKLGLEIKWGNVQEVKSEKIGFEILTDRQVLHTKALIIATGTESAKLNVPGEDVFRGRGVSYCATCDGAFYKDKNIFVVGGGNSAIEEAIFLTRYAKKVSIVHRRDALRADKILAESALSNPKIYFFWHSVVEEIYGKDKVEGVVLKDTQVNNRSKIPIDGVFIYIGSRPNSGIVKGLAKVNKDGFIITDDKMHSSLPGLFAAGDVREKPLHQVVTAVAEGAIAAEEARKFIEEGQK